MSATLDAGSFQVYFGNAPSLHIPGRAFPVQTLHVQQSTVNVLVSAANVAVHLHNTRPAGDILVFLSGEDEIERLCSFLRKETTNLDIMPLYSRMSRAEQDKINEPRLQRKCIVTTNIAETSLTIDGVVYVVDSGLAKHMLYNPRAQLSSLQVGLISKASARQRMGRAGRTQPGVCIRLYTKSTLENDMLPSNQPGIMYDRLDSLILTLKAAGVSDVRNFGFIDAPPPESLLRAMEELTDW